MSSIPQNSPEDPRIVALRSDVRGALLARKKADARDLLGRLLGLSDSSEDRANLVNLVQGVDGELRSYLNSRGEIRARLSGGTSLEAIQTELDLSIPHWRAFANDFAEFRLARSGLPPGEDPHFLARVKDLRERLAAGEVDAVLAEWEQLGAPPSSEGDAFYQIAELLTRLDRLIGDRDWEGARIAHSECSAFLKEEDCAVFRAGIGSYLHRSEQSIGWEELLIACEKALPHPSAEEKRRLALALYEATDAIRIRVNEARNATLEDLQKKVKETLDAVEASSPPVVVEASGVRSIVLVLLVILALLVGIWIFYRASAGSSGAEFRPGVDEGVCLSRAFAVSLSLS